MYKTVSTDGDFCQTINKSQFIAKITHIETEDGAREFIAKEKKKYPDARHCCWAYILGEKSDILRYGDDGEPQGTAGLPMLEVLKKNSLTNTAVAVTRYFGGILLGTGGLTRAYSSSCAGAVKEAEIATVRLCRNIEIFLDYSLYSAIKMPLEHFTDAKCTDTEYTDCVKLTFTAKSEAVEDFCALATELSKGKAKIKTGDAFFYRWCD